MGTIFNKLLTKFDPILKTCELLLLLLLQAEVSSLHQLHVGHPHWKYCPGLCRGGFSGNGRKFFCYTLITRQNGQFTKLWKDSKKAKSSLCFHFVLRSRTGLAPFCCGPPSHIKHRVILPQQRKLVEVISASLEVAVSPELGDPIP